ncbi:MAG: hypothetical protein ACRD4O_14790, partial [Bryobacteraceae bacterium]
LYGVQMAEQAGSLLMELSGYAANPYFAPLAGCAFVFSVSAVALVWCFLRRQIRQIRRELAAERERTQGIEDIPKQIEDVQARLEHLNERTVPPLGWSPVSESVHLNRRGQVLKMHRGGHSVCEIASGLGVSEGEVRLTLKLHGLLRSPAAGKAEEFSLIPERNGDRNTRGLWVKGARV